MTTTRIMLKRYAMIFGKIIFFYLSCPPLTILSISWQNIKIAKSYQDKTIQYVNRAHIDYI